MGVRLAEVTDPAQATALAPPAHKILQDLVSSGAALGWSLPPTQGEVRDLLTELLEGTATAESALLVAYDDGKVVGLGYWRRYQRQTHRPHADLERVAVAAGHQGRGIGRALTEGLVASARKAGIEVLTLDARGDNDRALALYRTLGFNEYGRLVDFVAVGHLRYDKVFYALDLRRPWPRL
jgi:ribosomal protein S18 acetylase RimI-like enzyme